MHDHVDGIDAIEFQIFVQARLRLDILRVNFKQLDQQRGDFCVNGFLFGHNGLSSGTLRVNERCQRGDGEEVLTHFFALC